MRTVELSPQRRAVLLLARDGLANKEIARQLNLTEQTVKVHMTDIHQILGVRTRTQAVVRAIKLGLIPLG